MEYFTRRYRWYAPGAERWRRLPFILTGSPDEAFAPSSGIYRTGSGFYAGWRLPPYPAYRVLSQAQTSQARASAAGQDIDTVPVISPGGGYALPGLQGPLTGSYP